MTEIDDLQNIGLKAREEIAGKVGRILAKNADTSDRASALELAKILVEDVAVSVRQALSKELRACNFLPKALIKTVAIDIEQISVPFLVASEAVDDAFLEELIRSSDTNTQEAVATRKGLSEAVSFAISDVGSQTAVQNLVNNDTADMRKRSFDRVLDRFPEERSLMEKLCQRADLPAEIVERLIFKVSRQFSEYMMAKYELSNDYSSYLISLANRQVFSRTLEMAPLSEVENYFQQLKSTDGLHSDLLLHYLQNGNVRLFTVSIAVLLGKPYEAVEEKINTGNKAVLTRLLEAAGFAKPVIGVLLIAYERLLRG